MDSRADVYSLGCTLYFLLTGQPPFPEGSAAQKLVWHQERMPVSVRSLRPQTPDRLATILDRMMAKDRADRYQTPGMVAEALIPWTRTAIDPPSEEELPRLSPAARNAGAADSEPDFLSSSHVHRALHCLLRGADLVAYRETTGVVVGQVFNLPVRSTGKLETCPTLHRELL